MPPPARPSRLRTALGCVAVFLVCSSVLEGCTAGGSDGAGDEASAPVRARVVAPSDAASVVASAGPGDLAAAASASLFDAAPVVLLAAEDELGAQARAAPVAVALGMPLLVTPGGGRDAGAGAPEATPVDDELSRLSARAVLAFGGAALRWARALDDGPPVITAPEGPEKLEALVDRELGDMRAVAPEALADATAALPHERPPRLTLDAGLPAPGDSGPQGPTEALSEEAGVPDPAPASDAELPEVAAAAPLDSVLVLIERSPASVAAAATARASGAHVVAVNGGDPRADAAAVTALAERAPEIVLALGSGFGTRERLAQRLAVARTGLQLPGGGQVLFPGRRLAALYGHPGTPALGVLGEQPVHEAIARARRLAADYQRLVEEPVVPAFEIIATVASSTPGPDGNYSSEAPVSDLRPWIDAAGQAGVYVVVDLQPGRTDFLTQARRYEELLAEPHVGLALDPEWRLGPHQRHLEQIGSVAADEVNAVAAWLAGLTQDRRLPQKLLLLHQFHLGMISDRPQVDTGHDELAVLIHADGFGTADQKFTTWNTLRRNPPPNLWWGWKNFHDEDQPMFTPAQTTAIEPSPRYVSYQ